MIEYENQKLRERLHLLTNKGISQKMLDAAKATSIGRELQDKNPMRFEYDLVELFYAMLTEAQKLD